MSAAEEAAAVQAIVTRLLAGDIRALARVISLLENDTLEVDALVAALYPHTGHAQTVGITGAPGSGKSTLVDALIRLVRAQGRRVAVLAVDPSSPYTGGAILGDRIRMGGYAGDSGVFIRSMGTRGYLGGLAMATDAALMAIDAAGWDLVIVETVGVGQSELEIADLAEVTAVVLTPAAGDAVQTLKAGLLEVADLFVVNKSDLPGATMLVRDLRSMLLHGDAEHSAASPIVQTEATIGRGVPELWTLLQQRHAGQERRRAIASRRIANAALALLRRRLAVVLARDGSAYDALVDAVAARALTPLQAARYMVEEPGPGHSIEPAGPSPRVG